MKIGFRDEMNRSVEISVDVTLPLHIVAFYQQHYNMDQNVLDGEYRV
jgi:hypothetical protein